jgi:hypothetical protein
MAANDAKAKKDKLDARYQARLAAKKTELTAKQAQ